MSKTALCTHGHNGKQVWDDCSSARIVLMYASLVEGIAVTRWLSDPARPPLIFLCLRTACATNFLGDARGFEGTTRRCIIMDRAFRFFADSSSVVYNTPAWRWPCSSVDAVDDGQRGVDG